MDLFETLKEAHAAEAAKPKGPRFFLRCGGCLATSVVEVPTAEVKAFKAGFAFGAGPECGSCGATFELIGPVNAGWWTKTKEEIPCDDRCVFAVGPNCDCKCAGANHGSGMLVTVVTAAGKATVTPVRAKVARARRWEFEAARHATREAIFAKFGRLFAAKELGERLHGKDWDDFLLGCWALKETRRARELKSHAGRMNALKKAAAV